MDHQAAEDLAHRLLVAHDLAHQGWTLEFNPRLRSAAGRCDDERKVIELATAFVEDHDEDQVRDTILHEVAHGLDVDNTGHRARWRHIATTIGATPTRAGLDVEPYTPADAAAVKEWADRIRPLLARTVEAMMDVGRELIAAKAALPHGAWMSLLAHLHISRHVAERFMRIARSETLKRAPAHILPAAPTILDELAKLPADDFTTAIRAGTITPDMSRDRARFLVDVAEARAEADAAAGTGGEEPVRRTRKQVWEDEYKAAIRALNVAYNAFVRIDIDKAIRGSADQTIDPMASVKAKRIISKVTEFVDGITDTGEPQ